MKREAITRAIEFAAALATTVFLAFTSTAATIELPASEEVFIRTLTPDTTHDADLISIRRLSGEVRYGVVQFDLSSLFGQTVTGVELTLDEIGSAQAGTDANFPLLSAAYLIGTAEEVPDLLSITWNTYQATYEGQEAGPLATLGAYDLPANGTARADRSTFANAADLAIIQGIVDQPANNILTLVLKAVDLNQAHAFGDGQYYGNKAILRVTTGASDPPVVTGIATEPTDPTNLPINSRVTLTATVTGTGPLSFQWHRNNQPVAGATSLTLVLSSLDPGTAGDYTLVVTGPGGTATSSVVSVTVDAAYAIYDLLAAEDVWIRDIAPSTTYNGDFVDVRRTVDTSMGPVEVRYGLIQFDLSSLAGETLTSAELILDELGTGQGAGSSAMAPIQTMAFAVAADHNAPDLLAMTWDIYASAYEDQEAYAFVSLGIYDLPANGALRANRSSLANADDLAFLQLLVDTGNKLTLVLKPVSYDVNLAHSFGDGEAAGNDAILRILRSVPTTPPTVSPITVLPGAVDVPVGTRVTLSVTANGTGVLAYQWRFGGQPIAGATSASLVLDAIEPAQGGDYTVVVTDLVGSTTSGIATVTVDASARQIECVEDVWIGAVAADRAFNGDFLDARRTAAGDVRYGVLQFDLSPFAGKTVTRVELILDELGSNQGVGSSATMPIQTTAFAIGATGNAPDLLATTWTIYQATYEGQEDSAFTTLGAYDLQANGALRADRSTLADPGDLAFIQGLVDAGTLFTLVLKPTDPGYDLAVSFGDGESGGNNARLIVSTALAPTLSVARVGSDLILSWPDNATGWTLQAASALSPPVTWNNVPGSTQTNRVAWPLSGEAGYFRLSQ